MYRQVLRKALGRHGTVSVPEAAKGAGGANEILKNMRKFDNLSEREILALAISLEEEERTYGDYAESLRKDYAASAAVFEEMAIEEAGHRRRLIELYEKRFGDHIPLIRRPDVSGFVSRKPVWLMQPLGLDTMRKQAATIREQALFEKAAERSQDPGTRQLLDDFAGEERSHKNRAEQLEEEKLVDRGALISGPTRGSFPRPADSDPHSS
jgi:erythrin-vacuolar iron transport family protein